MKKTRRNSPLLCSMIAVTAIMFQLSVSTAQNLSKNENGLITNSFFDNSQVYQLKMNDLFVEGEVKNPGKVDFSSLDSHSLIVKETIVGDDGNPKFVGAYKYNGYSLSEILDPFLAEKINAVDFPPLIDLYVEIENKKGEKIIISWGEIYYSNLPHNIILATQVMRIVPEKTKEQWVLPVTSKLIIGNDLLTVRNIDNPTKISVKTFQKEMVIEKGKYPLQSESIKVHLNDRVIENIDTINSFNIQTCYTVFYGKGRGLHSTNPITGYSFKDAFSDKILLTTKNLQTGLVLMGADDGYRAVFTLSELLNRNDQQFSLLIHNPGDEKSKGLFRFLSTGDFFSDRAVKGLTDIWFYLPE